MKGRELLPILGIPLLIVIIVVIGSRFVDVPTSPLEGAEAPDFALPVMAGPGAAEGDRIALADLRGRVVLLDFWATWCPPCRESIPMLSRIHDQYVDRGVSVVGINMETLDQSTLRSAHHTFGGSFPTVQDSDEQLSRAYQVTELPTLVVIDPQGVIRSWSKGVPNEEELVSTIESLLD